MWKRGGLNTKLQKRYFILKEGMLTWFKQVCLLACITVVRVLMNTRACIRTNDQVDGGTNSAWLQASSCPAVLFASARPPTHLDAISEKHSFFSSPAATQQHTTRSDA
jgi:hypothetical protein